EEILIYVNDKPTITSRPETLFLLARQLFAYRILVNDRNPDARLDYRLESGPEGMSIGRDGILTWRTNETHHDDYQVVISVSDGFDKDVQTFTLNVNAELTITSVVPHVAHLQMPYRYQVMYFQPGARKEHSFSLLQAPDGMAVDTTGLITWTPTSAQIDTHSFQVRISDGTSEDVQEGWVVVNAQPKIVSAPPPAVVVLAGDTLRLAFKGRDPNASQAPRWDLAGGPVRMSIDSAGVLTWPTSSQDLDAARYVLTLSDGVDETQYKGIVFVNSPVSITSTPPDSAIVGRSYRYPLTIRDDNRASLLKFRRPTVVTDLDRTVAYQVEVLDDKIRRDLPRYLAQFRELQNIFINKPRRPAEGDVAQAARIDLKQHVKHIFVSEDRLVLVIHSPEQGFVELEDVLWELFQGGRGIMPQYTAERVPFFHYSLQAFPDGMTVDNERVITWRPTPSQAGHHQVRLTVSDGFTRDQQSFQVYANHAPAIISQPDTMAVTDQRYTYRVRADDKNADARLTYRLIRHPEGMQVDARGMVTWLPSVEQLNWQEFEIEVSDGHASDRQSATVFVNMLPRIISQPRPVALNNFEYRYRLVAEDLNRDDIQYNATRLPRYSDFDPRTGLFKWRPRDIQKGANDVILEVTDTHGGVTVHEFQVHVFEDPSRRQFLFTGWPLMLAFVGVIFVLGIAVGA
ncbi:MAG: Ig domain-containing protein, partial [Candidatus Neomarinimicrobiota bacterium]